MMTQRVVKLGNGKVITLATYVAGWRKVKQDDPSTKYKHGLSGWWSDSAQEILADYRKGLHERINRHIPEFGKGRKWSTDWYWQMWRTSRELNTPRLAIHWLPFELRERFAHRLSD